MKKFSLLCSIFIFTALCVTAGDYSFLDNGSLIKANISKQGNFIKMNYRIDTPASENGSETSGTNSQQLGSMNVTIVASCVEPKMKFVNFDTPGIHHDNSMLNTWIPITNVNDYKMILNACSNGQL